MKTVSTERRTPIAGSIICENSIARLRVMRVGPSLSVFLDVRDEDGGWTSLSHTPIESTETGELHGVPYINFDLIQRRGKVCGAILRSAGRDEAVSLAIELDREGPICRCRYSCSNERQCQAPTNRWILEPEIAIPDVYWPHVTVHNGDLAGNPAGFFQLGPVFATLIPDLEEGDYLRLGLHTLTATKLGFEYGMITGCTGGDSAPIQFAYWLALNTRTVEQCGFQQMVRLLGRHEGLKCSRLHHYVASPGPIPELPSCTMENTTRPFAREGSIQEIAAVCAYYLRHGQDDWRSLDHGLCWLDRLCYHQHLYEIPGGVPFGGFPLTAGWETVRWWMPELLLTAFQSTGILEYAHRGMAALAALPTEIQGPLLNRLRKRFGDIFLDVDQGEVLLFCKVDFAYAVKSDGIQLTVGNRTQAGPLCIVIQGILDAYQVSVNGISLGEISNHDLRLGIELPFA